MDLIDRIETTRFLGSEFVLWLWLSHDVQDGELTLPIGTIGLTLGTQLMLSDPLTPTESVHVRGQDPCSSSEAERALQQGKLPRKVGMRLTFESSEWAFTLDTATLRATGVKLPALLSEGEEEHFHERMRLLEQLHGLVRALYARFLGVRLSPAWDSELAPALQSWVASGSLPAAAEYEAWHDTLPGRRSVGSQRRRTGRKSR